jgi:uncharacterized membrane protein YkvA (DUF1232 family)
MSTRELYDEDVAADEQPFDSGLDSKEETEEGIEYVQGNLWRKLEKANRSISFARDIVALFKYMVDPAVAWYRKGIVVAALIYFISPLDAIPDIAPLIGYLDDLGVIAALIKYLGHEISPYYAEADDSSSDYTPEERFESRNPGSRRNIFDDDFEITSFD